MKRQDVVEDLVCSEHRLNIARTRVDGENRRPSFRWFGGRGPAGDAECAAVELYGDVGRPGSRSKKDKH